jgi:hypothetical protein
MVLLRLRQGTRILAAPASTPYPALEYLATYRQLNLSAGARVLHGGLIGVSLATRLISAISAPDLLIARDT